MGHLELSTLIFAVIGGALPPLVWLWFWLKEDKHHPEPKSLIVATFIGGMLTVPIALYVERMIALGWPIQTAIATGGMNLFVTFVILVLVEEVVKFIAAQGIAFPNKNFDEPVDAVIYMITAALGFASLENTLFILEGLTNVSLVNNGVFLNGGVLNELIINNNLRFIGANVLHTVTSGFVGILLGLAFYKRRIVKIFYISGGLATATLLHALFNFSIITFSDRPVVIFSIFWMMAVFLILLFEELKTVTKY